jgi:anti-sigma regulatory factor (Ser/Thr protein kinase)
MSIDKETIRRRALELIAADGRGVGPKLAQEFGLSRQVANGYLQTLLREGLIQAEGSTRARVYVLVTLAKVERQFPREGLQEDVVWREVFAPLLRDLPQGVRDIWHYGLTEMINNAIDHSGSPAVRVGLRRNALFTEAWVADEGEGIFLKIQRALDLFDTREAILELAKGKLTTAPKHHSGEGIFFTSRMMDGFDIQSGNLHFRHEQRSVDVIKEQSASAPGTLVTMRLANDSPRIMQAVFDEYADPEDYTFDKTVVPVCLAQHEGEKLVSRSQAKRVAHRFERFKKVELDFQGVAEIGQAFADEIFRVFAAEHPDIRLTPKNMSPAVDNMIRRALSAGATRDQTPHGNQ